MLTILLAGLVVLVILAVILWRYGPDTVRIDDPHARPWRWAALGVMGLYVIFLVFMGVGEMVGGDFSGASHLLPAAMLGVAMYLASKRPRESGVVLLLIGAAISAYFAFVMRGDVAERLIAIAFGGLPWLVAGLLLLAPELRGHGGGEGRLEQGV